MKHICRSLVIAAPLAFTAIGVAHADPIARAKTYLSQDKPRDAILVLRNYLRNHITNGPANFMLAKLDLELGSPVSASREARAARAAGYRPNRALTLLLESYLAQQRYIDLLHDNPVGSATGDAAARLELGRAAAEEALNRDKHAIADVTKAQAFDAALPAVWLAKEHWAHRHGDATAAARDLAHAKSLDPKNTNVMLAEARSALISGKPKDAVTILKAVLGREPSNIGARVTLANAMLAAGQPGPAQTEITTVLKVAPGSIGALYLQAGLYVSQKKWKQAEVILQHLSPLMNDLPGAYFLQAQTLLHRGEDAAAMQAAAHYVAHVPADPAGRRLLAALALKNHHPHVALNTLNAAGPALQHDFGMLMLRGVTEQALNDPTGARVDFTRAAKLAPTNAQPQVRLAALDVLAGKLQSATTRFGRAAALAPSNPGIQAALAEAAIASGDHATARRAIKRLDQLKGAEAGALLSAQLHLASFDLNAAKADYARALKAQPNNVEAALGLAHIALLQGHAAQAETVIAKAVKADPGNQATVSALASLLASTNKFDKTNEVLQAAHKAAPNNPVFIADLASLDIRLKKLDQAHTMLDGVSPALQNNPLILAAKAQVALAGHDSAGAKAALASLVRHDPHDVGARLDLVRLDASTNDISGATEAVAQGLKVMPHNMALLQADVGLATKQGGMAAGEGLAEKLAADPAHQPESVVLPGKLFLAEHHLKRAVAAFASANRTSPSAVTSLDLAQAQALSGNAADATATLDQAIASFGPLPSLENAAGQIALASNDLPKAAAHYQTALSKAPNDVLALNNLAWIAGKQNKKGAAGLAARAYAISPSPQIADTLGWILARQSKPKQALILLDQAHQGMPGDPNVTYHYASVLAQTGAKAKAAAILKTALATKAAFSDRAAAEKLDASLGKS